MALKKKIAVAKIKAGGSKTTRMSEKIVSTNSGSTVVVAKPTVARGNGTPARIYDDAVKEIVSLSENDSHAKKIDNGALSEARGKDVWALHAQLRATDQLADRLETLSSKTQTAVATVDQHLHDDTVATTTLLRQAESSIMGAVANAQSTLTDSVSKAQSSLSRGLKDGVHEIQQGLTNLLDTVKDSFSKLSKATAGSEENLKSQTAAFSKATENLLGNLQHEIEKRVSEFRDESTRQVDKRFNQTDVAFAAIRADQEVIKSLLTDIIKDRLGRAEPKVR